MFFCGLNNEMLQLGEVEYVKKTAKKCVKRLQKVINSFTRTEQKHHTSTAISMANPRLKQICTTTVRNPFEKIYRKQKR
jgi:hypothetical protein